MTGRINRCSHCGCDEPILGIDGKLYCDNCGMCLESTLPSHAQASKLEGGLTIAKIEKVITYTLHNVDINQLRLIYKALKYVEIDTIKESEDRDMLLFAVERFSTRQSSGSEER